MLIVEKVMSDEEVKNLNGSYIDESFIKHDIVNEDCDCYTKEGVLLFKFRKSVIPKKYCDTYLEYFKDLAPLSRGRGASAGPIDPEIHYWKNRGRVITETKGFSTKYMNGSTISKMRINNPVYSNPVGFYEPSISFGGKPCRLTKFTIDMYKEFFSGMPYIRRLADSYRELNPEKYKEQLDRALETPEFMLPETPFSTITFNRNFRTAVHTDKGDFGFGNLSVLERGEYEGGYFVIPQYGVAINMRSGDHLCVDVHQYHGNTKMWETPTQKLENEKLPPLYKRKDHIGVMGELDKYTRISLVCYLREKLKDKCKGNIMETSIERRSFKNYEPNYKYFINLDKDTHRLPKWKDRGFVRVPATHYESPEAQGLGETMISFWNVRNTKQHYAKCGCYHSHASILEKIVKNKMDMVLICEDDAIQVKDIPEFRNKKQLDGVIYLGGFIHNKQITSNEKVNIDHKIGLNELDKDKYRMCMTLSYLIPKWEVAEEILQNIFKKEPLRIRAIDIDLSNNAPKIYYEYPACFIEESGESSIRDNKTKHSNEKYEWK